MPGIDMTEFMTHQCGQLGFTLQTQKNPPGEADGAAWKSISVHIGGINSVNGIGHLEPMGVGGDVFSGAGQVCIQLLILQFTVIRRELVRRVLTVDADFFFLKDQHQLLSACNRVGGATK